MGQFRPEKDHALQIRAFAKFLSSMDVKKRYQDTQLVLIGGCRNEEDQARVEMLRTLATDLNIAESIVFKINVPFSEILSSLGSSSIGLHSMWNEHFGICVVEMMAAGLITIAHKSGGPQSDIVVPLADGSLTGYLAATPEEYAEIIVDVLSKSEKENESIRNSARVKSQEFSDEKFMDAVGEIFLQVLKTAAMGS